MKSFLYVITFLIAVTLVTGLLLEMLSVLGDNIILVSFTGFIIFISYVLYKNHQTN